MYATHLPTINFDELFSIKQNHGAKVAKTKMIINYFKRISEYCIL